MKQKNKFIDISNIIPKCYSSLPNVLIRSVERGAVDDNLLTLFRIEKRVFGIMKSVPLES